MKPDEPAHPDSPVQYRPDLLHEDNHVIVVNKPAGMLVQGDSSDRVSLFEHVKRYIKHRDHKPGNVFLGMVQRLDRQVSGAIVFAKTSKGAQRISRQIRERKVLKYYVAATTTGSPDARAEAEGESGWRELRDHLKRSGTVTVACRRDDPGAQSAVLLMKTLYSGGTNSVHLIRLITGRKHQIRAQLANRGMPILGDGKYGFQGRADFSRILLHSCFVRFEHPTLKSDLSIKCPPSPEFWPVFSAGVTAEIISRMWYSIDLQINEEKNASR